jgi:methyltransferase
MTPLVIILSIVIIQRLSELVLAKRNYNWAMQRGGKEFGAGHYWLFWVLHTTWIFSLALECLIRQPPFPRLWPVFLFLVVVAQILRYWAIRSLGRCWNTRIVVFNGMCQVEKGPYQYFKHPNYVAVAIEIAAIPALLGAWYSALFFSIVNAALLLIIRIPQEQHALHQHLSEEKH